METDFQTTVPPGLSIEEWEMVLEAVAKEGIADAEAGRYITIASVQDGEAWLERKMAELRGIINE